MRRLHARAFVVAVAVAATAMGLGFAGLLIPVVVLALLGLAGWLVVQAWTVEVPQSAQVTGVAVKPAGAGISSVDRVATVARMAESLPRHLVAHSAAVQALAAAPPRDAAGVTAYVDALSEGVGR